MAVDIKVAPDEKLELVQTYITDTNANSDYFNISELPDTFSGGKNAFLIAGTDKLLANTEIKIQIRDANGNVCYVEYSNGNPEYYEGNSKVAAVYVYPTLTAFGPATITILGQLKDVPQEWNGLYSVKWQKQVNINPALANTTRVRFYKRPAVTIKELLQPLYSIVSGSKVASLVTQSFASITVNQLETFAGDVARVKVFRTSAGDISDYDLIQDISIEAKNLLTTYELTGSVVGNAGLFGPDSLKKVWNTSSLHAVLDSTYVADGLQLTGSGTFRFTSSLSLLSTNTYNLELDTFYTGSTATNLIAYISGSGSAIYPITTFSGSIPTKNFGTTTIPFTIPNDAPTASLYFSQSSGTNQWHIGNISLNLSQDTAFSPNEISFITSMPTVLGNETFNFKFEFYDINNNYVPVAVTQSVVFNGGNNNIGGTLILISGSTSASNASILALSQSVSGTIGNVTASVSQSFVTSSAYSASLQSSSLYISSSLSSSISSSISSSYSSSTYLAVSASKFVSASAASASNFNYAYATYLDGNIFTDSTGKLIKTPATSSTQNGLYTGQTYLGYYSGSSWKTYMANNGNFYLTSSVAGGGFMAWNAAAASLNIAGSITVLGGDAATQTFANTAASVSSSAAATAVSTSLAPNIFTDSNGKIVKPPVNTASNYGLFLGSDHLGFYGTSGWQTYMDNLGKFYLTGSASNYLKWDGSVLTIAGAINITGGQAATDISTAQTTANTGVSNAATAQTTANNASTAASTAATAANYALLNANTSSISEAATAAGFALINANTASIFTDSTGKINKTPATGTQTGLFLGDSYMGYYNGSAWKTYMQNNGNFYLSGTNGYLSWNAGADTLGIKGDIIATNITATTTGNIAGWQIDGSRFYKNNIIAIDSTNRTIDFFDGSGMDTSNIKTRLTYGTANIGSTVTNTITVPSASVIIDGITGTNSNPAPVTGTRTVSSTVSSFNLTVPSAASGKISILVPYPQITPSGYAAITIGGSALSYDYSSTIQLRYTIDSPGDSSITGTITLQKTGNIHGYTSVTATIPGINGGTARILSSVTAVPNKVYSITYTIDNIIYVRLNPTSGVGTNGGSITYYAYGIIENTATALLLSVASRAEYGSNGLQIGSDEGSYAAIGNAAGAGYVGLFAGNVSVVGTITGGVASSSDRRAKTNIQPIGNALDKIKLLNPVDFDWLQHITGNYDFKNSYGFIADEVEKDFPQLVMEKKGHQYDDFKYLDYNSFHALAIKAIQELSEKIEKLEAQLSGSN